MIRACLAVCLLSAAIGVAGAAERGLDLFAAGRFEEAAGAFDNAAWRGAAFYRAGRFRAAADAFRQAGDAASLYNLGNALAHLDDFGGAVQAYDAALERDPDNADARANRELVAGLQSSKSDAALEGTGGFGGARRRLADDRDLADEDADSRPASGDGAAGLRRQEGGSATQGSGAASERGSGQSLDAEVQGASSGSASDAEGMGRSSEGASPEAAPGADGGRAERSRRQEIVQATEQWLASISDDTSRLLRARLAFEQQRREAAGIAVPAGMDPW